MGKIDQGRRIPWNGGNPYALLTQGGDYCGPVTGYTGDLPAMFFLLPNARDEGVHPELRSMRYIRFPPHQMFEEPDGSLTIGGSILSHTSDGKASWHGFLEKGIWREC